MKSISDNDEQEKKTLELLKDLESSEVTYPPELLKARRAAFLAQVDQMTSATSAEPELTAADEEIVELLGRLKSKAPRYPAHLLAARRSAFLGQLARAQQLTWWERLQQSIPRLPALAPGGFKRTSLAIAVLMAAAWVGSWLFLRNQGYLRPAPLPGLGTPTSVLPTDIHEAALLLCQPGEQSALCASPALASSPDLAEEAPAVSSQASAPAAYANDNRSDTSWVGSGPDSWIKVDLGEPTTINSVTFRKGSVGPSNDPGQFVIAVALSDVYSDGNSQGDMAEYAQVFNSEQSGFSGRVGTTETVRAVFPAVKARFVKITFQRAGASIDGLGVFMVKPPAQADAPTRTPAPQDTRTPLPTATRFTTETVLPSPTGTAPSTETLAPSPTPFPATETALPTLTDTIIPASETPLPLSTETATPFALQSLPTETAPPPTVQTVQLPILSLVPIVVNGHNQNLVLTCAGDAVEVSGNNNFITLLGSCSSITVTGNHNQVLWQAGAPLITDLGNQNTISQQ